MGFQSSLPRGERPKITFKEVPHKLISILAPTRGATVLIAFKVFSVPISILAPTRGATSVSRILLLRGLFQSSLPRGERRDLSRNSSPITGISILAPTRGATPTLMRQSTVTEFQSSLPRGERHRRSTKKILPEQFQSSLPRGERLCGEVSDRFTKDFNPRSHEGSDFQKPLKARFSVISILAPTRGATIVSKLYFRSFLFQSSLPRGERLE